MSRQLRLDTLNYDLVVTDYQLTFIEDPDAVAQKIESTLNMFRAEWFLNQAIGVPYFQSVFGKADIDEVNALFLSVVNGVVGVEEVLSFETDYIETERKYTVDFEVRVTSGEIVEGSV